MATIIQINRIATNRPGAVTDTVTRLQSAESADVVNIAAQHLPLDPATFTITDGTVSATPTTINLSDVQVYATTTARNAATNIEWHVGDVAIVSGPTSTAGEFAQSNFPFTSFIDSTSFRSAGGWDTTNGVSLLDFEVGDVLQFRTSTGTIAGSTTGGTDFTVTTIEQFSTTTQAQVTLNRAYFPADGVSPAPSNGDLIFVQQMGTSIPANTYLYTGTDQTSAAATTDDDWTVLRTPTASEAGGLPVTRTAQTGSLTIASSGVTVTGDNVAFANSLFTFTSGGTGSPTFPTAVVLEIYVDGLKISSNEVSDITTTSFTLTGAREALDNSGNFVVEIVWRD